MKKLLTLSFALFLLVPSVQAQVRATQVELRTSFAEAVNKVAPAVVNIFTEKVVQRRQVGPFAGDPFFSHFFDDFLAPPARKRLERSLGSGVILTPDGYMVTNYHVIAGANKVRVTFSDNREITARFISADEELDIAIMKLELEPGESVPHASFGDDDTLQVGDVVLAIGNPFGVGQSVSMGIVSALDRSQVGISPYASFIQTDAAINPGNSGGALIDSNGTLIGVNTAIFTRSGASNGIGFAIPASSVRAILNSVITTGRVQQPWFGASGQNLVPALAERLGLETPEGVLINEIVPGGPAERAGLAIGDIILTLDGHEITDTGALGTRLRQTPLDQPVELTIWHEGREKSLSMVLETLPERKAEDRLILSGNHPLDGYVVEQLSPALNSELDLPLSSKGVAIVEMPTGRHSRMLQLQPGDVIVSVNKHKVSSLQQLQGVLERPARAWQMTYRRGNSVYRVFLQ